MTLGEIATLIGIIFSIGSVIGVYVNMQVRLAVMKERGEQQEIRLTEKVNQQEKLLAEHKNNHKDFSNHIDEMLGKIFNKMSDIEKELGQKANINYNGSR